MQQINIYLMEYGWFQVIGRMMVCLALVFMAYKDVREHKVSVIALIGCGLITGIESGIAVVTGGLRSMEIISGRSGDRITFYRNQ